MSPFIVVRPVCIDQNQRLDWIPAGMLSPISIKCRNPEHSIIFLPGLVVGRLFDVGLFRILCAGGSVLIVLATFLVPLGRTLTHFLLCQSLAFGVCAHCRWRCNPLSWIYFDSQLGCGLVFLPTTAVVCHWWKRLDSFGALSFDPVVWIPPVQNSSP
jgi:hypothetical protein